MTGTGGGSTAPPFIARCRLVARILAADRPLVVIEAPAGTGKTWLLRELAAAAPGLGGVADGASPPASGLWDVPVSGATGPLEVPRAGQRLILARRPDSGIPGLARARVYGAVLDIGTDDLLASEAELTAAGLTPAEAAAVMARTGGWLCLYPAGQADPGVLADFLRDEVLAHYPSPAVAALGAHLAEPARRFDARLLAGLPFVRPGAALHPALEAVRQPMLRAVRQTLAVRAEDPTEARAIAVTQAALGQTPAAIATFQSIGAWEAAIGALRQASGPFYIHRFGPRAMDRMLAGFPPDLLLTDETLVLSRAVQAVKRGEVALTLNILSARWGEGMTAARGIMADRRLPLAVRYFRFLVRTWEDFDLPDHFLDDAYRLHAEIPADDDLTRGGFFNAVLEFYIRVRRFPEAEHVALQAAAHYARAGVTILSFYIELHLAVIRLMQADTAAARRHAAGARRLLRATPYDSPGDARILGLVDACIAFEGGQPEPLHRFLTHETDALAQGEIWPTIVELVVTYGSQALAEAQSPVAARAFLDRWRVRQERAAQFRSLIDIREVALLQSAGRWAEAGQAAAALPGRITQGFVLAGGERLAALEDRDEVAMALIWLRQMAQTAPQRPGLDRLIAVMLDNPHLLGRQRMAARIWLVEVLRRTRRTGEAEAALVRLLADAAREGAVATLAEERVFLTDILAVRRLRDAAEADPEVRRLLRGLMAPGPARAAGLTRQETRMLRAIAEGSPNKSIASMLGLSESTVKFHLANLYRKLGARDRRAAVAAAARLRLIR
ncbi:MAG: LuxR family transcriptional regulator [Rubellimicrobium sp.]|nr:LuxR family transcriptional regulator [Rubellimicrobium sp.]